MKLIFLILTFSLALFSNCEQATEVKFDGNNPPTFILSGSGALRELIIYGPRQRDVGSDRSFALWEIEPTNGDSNTRGVEDIGSIKYGIVPDGYKQIYPENGAPPPPLTAGPKYEYWMLTEGAPHAREYFEIRDNKAVVLPKPGRRLPSP